MSNVSVSRHLTYPVWAHGEYAEGYEAVRALVNSL